MEKIFEFEGLFDSHSHFNMIEASKEELVKEALDKDVTKIVDVATDYESSLLTLNNSSLYPETILPTIGIHPEWLIPGSDMFDSSRNEDSVATEINKLKTLIFDNPNKFFMVGETGLDYYWLEKNIDLTKFEVEKSISLQKQLFEAHLQMALENNLPVTIHARNSYRDCIDIVSKYKGKIKAIFHSFTESYEDAQEIMELGFPIGINGIITYRSAQNLRDTITRLAKNTDIKIPKDLYDLGIYIESDSPLLIPSNIPDRKKYNSPASIKFIWEFIYNLLNQ
jgi:TatD DNase family protein